MYEDNFAAELAKYVGRDVEVTTDNSVIEGVLSTVTSDLVLVIELNSGYDTSRQYVAANAINFVRLPVGA